MGICKCGKKFGGSGKQCRRCAALQELGLTHGANEKSIRTAYFGQVKAWHPDRHMKTKAQQLAADEKTKRINVAYKFLTAPSKKGDAPSSRRSTGTPASPSRTTHGTGYSQQPPKGSSATRTKRSRSSRQAIPHYPQRDFIAWKAAFDNLPMGRTKAAEGLKKWIKSVADDRASLIAFAVSCGTAFGSEYGPKNYAKPEDARGDVLKTLWNSSKPNLGKRIHLAKTDTLLLREMEKLKESVNLISRKIEERNKFIMSQDGVFPVRLHDVYGRCIQLSASITIASALVKREYIQPLDLADCCKALVWELEENHGLSQAECHALIECALLSHGCAKEQVAPFGAGSVERGTIRAKKNAFVKGVRDSYDVIAQVLHNSKQSVPDATMKKSPL